MLVAFREEEVFEKDFDSSAVVLAAFQEVEVWEKRFGSSVEEVVLLGYSTELGEEEAFSLTGVLLVEVGVGHPAGMDVDGEAEVVVAVPAVFRLLAFRVC